MAAWREGLVWRLCEQNVQHITSINGIVHNSTDELDVLLVVVAVDSY